jgi:hypothetical protein
VRWTRLVLSEQLEGRNSGEHHEHRASGFVQIPISPRATPRPQRRAGDYGQRHCRDPSRRAVYQWKG